VRRSPLRFVVIPLALVLCAVGVYALASGGLIGGTVVLLTGLALIGLCTFDAPPSGPPAQTQDPVEPWSPRERAMNRLLLASMILTFGGATTVSVSLDVAWWYSGPAAIVLFMLLTAGISAWGLREPYWLVLRRGITSLGKRG
jgi:hypothetical protein